MKNILHKDLLIIPILDYSDDPSTWLSELQALFNQVLSKDLQILISVIDKHLKIDWEPELHEFIQLCLRSLCLKYDLSLIYLNSFNSTRLIELVSYLLNLPLKINQKFSIEPIFIDELIIPKSFDTWGKISTLSDLIKPEEEINSWNLTDKNNLIIKYEKIIPISKKITKKPEKKELKEIETVSLNQFLSKLYDETKSNKIANILGK